MSKYDVVIVGAGNAALCAAISAKEQGSSVLVLEKGPVEKRGGNSFFTDGAIRVAYQDLDAITKVIDLDQETINKIEMPVYSAQDFNDDIMRVSKNQSKPELIRQLVTQSFPTIEWMKSHGVEFELNYANQSFEKEGKVHFWGGLPIKTVDKGIGLMRSLFNRCEELGIDVWYESAATNIVTENEAVAAIEVQTKDGLKTVKCESVVLACGSIEANQKKRAEALGEEWNEALVRGTEFNTGDGIEMAVAIGAQTFGQVNGCHAIGTDANAPRVGDFQKPGDIYKKHSYPYSVMVNVEGNRFVDEGADFRNYTYAKYGKEVLKQPKNIAYQIYDAKVRPILRAEYDLEEATVFEATTLEALADQLDINKEQFLQTIAEYNAAVQEGEFNPSEKDGKGTKGITPSKSNWAQTISEGPFYAYPVTCGITFSFWGLATTPEGAVLNKSNEIIEGLYAAGEMIGGIFYENYPGGSGLMSGSVFGKLAGAAASRHAQKVK
ncbi:tricarballylate dehydrogenase [Lysinibacillus composti]|uniref:FAD-binding dehydrogenase n=1 Tax=Lysinibacillus composti TaxID=720633 RepID=A0A3N9UHU2_9BACI|nr:FAD-dependent tricarballylate dehydrogenase TcuA [Lysinibacillus composti]MBM7609681.1 tricarballylate dehydrogenase [Lysinibacillus composti]RQW75617.1 FAD-binding dehydrogenase [Lysinibacillus composti]